MTLINKDHLVIPLGDPAGIGIEITLKALRSSSLPGEMKPLLIGCRHNLELVYSQLKSQGVSQIVDPAEIQIEDWPLQQKVIPGQPTAETGKASFLWLSRASELVLEGQARALVTAPIAKYAWHEAGYLYAGQTERLAEITGVNHPSMLFTAVSPKNGWRINTLLATSHIPLSKVPETLTPELVFSKLETLLTFCTKFKSNPILAVAGLNPHAGEEGQLGHEEKEWLIPILKKWQEKYPGIKLYGPLPPDTCWISASHSWSGGNQINSVDGILALYHDQGLIPMKLIAFDEAVNTTLGLPFIRTSPDHGTAFDIAGKGCARPNSMLAALKTAWELTEM